MVDALNLSLTQHFGFEQFRPGQEQTIQQLLAGASSLAVFPTGSGKSLCYQMAALHLPHLTVVVSPLLALMKDQLVFLDEKGVAAASIDSSLTPEESRQVMASVRAGEIKILMVSVERFKNERFRQFIESVPVSMLVVDEAHCISEWGHNFRPDYLKLPVYRQALSCPVVLLLTATATARVKRDMMQRFAIVPEHVVQTGFYRSNLDLSVLPVAAANKDEALRQFIRRQSGAGIIYVTLQHSAEQVAQSLRQHKIHAVAYHAGFDHRDRKKIQEDFMTGQIQIVVATIAFGMGIDKADIRFVVHYDLPKSIENYSQEIGRAGRDGLPSNCVTLANLDGVNTVENFVFGDTPEFSGIECVIENIKTESQHGQWELQVVGLSNTSNIRQLPLKTLLVQLELLGVLTPMYAYFAEFKFQYLCPKETILARFEGERKDFLTAVFACTAFKKVWGTLDFDRLYREYACERGRVVSALEYLQEQNLIALETKRITEVFAVNQAALDDEHLATTLQRYFLDKEQKEIERIDALLRFFELDSCLSHHLALYFDDSNVPVSCGHCSVCRGEVAKLTYSLAPQWPEEATLKEALTELRGCLAKKTDQPLSLDICCRFLAGISVPLFSRNKVRQLSGFGLCELQRYEDIRKKLSDSAYYGV